MALGKNVKVLRELRKLTYDAVGSAVGTDGQNIFNLEKRDSSVSRFAPALAKLFEIDLDVLASSDLTTLAPDELNSLCGNRSQPQEAQPEPTSGQIDPDVIVGIVNALRQLSVEHQRLALAQVESVVTVAAAHSRRRASNEA